MTRSLDPYIPLRDSGIPWLGEIPAHWPVSRLRHISPFITVGVVVNPSSYVTADGVPFLYGSDVTEEGINAMSARRIPPEVSRGELAKTCLRAGDVVTVRVGAPGVAAVVPPDLEGANCASIMLVRGDSSFDSRWLAFAMNSSVGRHQVALVQYGAAQEQFNISHAVDFLFAVPPLEEQRAIADYLERETARLYRLVAAKERVLGLLAEKRRALITRAVTRGLDPRTPFRNSGSPWLGEIPAHWELMRLKHFAGIYYGLSQPPDYVLSGVPFLRATNVKRGELTKEGLVFVDEADLPDSRVVRLCAGDIIVVRSGAYTGDSAIVTEEWGGAVAGYDMVARVLRRAVPEFVSRALLCQYVLEAQIDPLRLRAAQPHLNAEELGDISFALPPIDEQRAIVAHIAAETAKLDALRTATERTIALLKERRAALIAAAVTGRLDVQGTGRHLDVVAD